MALHPNTYRGFGSCGCGQPQRQQMSRYGYYGEPAPIIAVPQTSVTGSIVKTVVVGVAVTLLTHFIASAVEDAFKK